MNDQAARTQIPVELGMVRRLDAMIAVPGSPLGSYTAVINGATGIARRYGTPDAWAFAERYEVHEAATRGDLVLIEVDDATRQALDNTLRAAQGIVTYTPTYGTAIGWILDVAAAAGYPAPGE